jgi:hypothetical protein
MPSIAGILHLRCGQKKNGRNLLQVFGMHLEATSATLIQKLRNWMENFEVQLIFSLQTPTCFVDLYISCSERNICSTVDLLRSVSAIVFLSVPTCHTE